MSAMHVLPRALPQFFASRKQICAKLCTCHMPSAKPLMTSAISLHQLFYHRSGWPKTWKIFRESPGALQKLHLLWKMLSKSSALEGNKKPEANLEVSLFKQSPLREAFIKGLRCKTCFQNQNVFFKCNANRNTACNIISLYKIPQENRSNGQQLAG